MHAEDKQFVQRLLAGDERAYDELFQVHSQKVFRFALARVRDRNLAEELVQSSLTKAIPKFSEYRGESSLTTWLCAFCRFEILSHRRKVRTRGVEVELPDDLESIERSLDFISTSDSANPETRLLRAELAHLIRTLLDRLPGKYGDILEWKYQEGLSVAEIAQRLEVSRTSVQSILARARQSFRLGFADLSAATQEASTNSTPNSTKG